MNVLGLAAVLAASLTLAACGGGEEDTAANTQPTPPAIEAAPPAMEAAPPAMQAAPPAMQAAPPAMEAAPPAMQATPPAGGELTLAAITGRWATSPVACGVAAEETVIATDTVTRGTVTCTINSATPGLVGLQLALSCTGGAAPTTETWTVAAPSVAPPVTAIGITAGTDTQALVRCN
jgi:hypothetical protein